MARGSANLALRLTAAATAAAVLASPLPAAERPEPPERSAASRRAETLERLQAEHPSAGFRLEPMVPPAGAPHWAAPAPGPAAPVPPSEQDKILAGHLLRRISFGPSPVEFKKVLRMGRERYIETQLRMASSAAPPAGLPRPPRDKYSDYQWIVRWYARMVKSPRQLLERMTLIWHEHFATSNEKVGIGSLMQKQETLLRKYALRGFRDLLVNVTKDQAMLIWLDNDYNDGNATDDEGNRIPPNANYAREFLQLFSMGPVLLNLDGTPITDSEGVPLPSYTEEDIKEIARAFTGWRVEWERERYRKSIFEDWMHDSGTKTILGVTVPGRTGKDGAKEVEDVVAIVMAHPNTAPFISKVLIQKLATETPTPGYVERVATVFRDSGGDLKRTVRTILNDPEFIDPANVRTQYKEPIEYFTLPIRALEGKSKGEAFVDWTYLTKQLLYYPPSVFSFYPPGQKVDLVNSATVTYRDSGADALAAGWWDTYFRADILIRKYKLTTPEQVVDFVADALLHAPLDPAVRSQIVSYMEGRVDEQKFRGAVWLLMTSPDYQRN